MDDSEFLTQQGEIKLSRFNSAEAINFRIDRLWQKFQNLVLKGNLIKANWVLDRVWGELVADATKEDSEFFLTLMKELSEIQKDFKVNLISGKNKFYAHLIKKETFLRILQNKQGKGTAYEESIEDYMDG